MARARKYRKKEESTANTVVETPQSKDRTKELKSENDREPVKAIKKLTNEDLGFLEGLEERLEEQKKIFDRAFGDKDTSAVSSGMEDRQDIGRSRGSRKLKIDDEAPYKYEEVGVDSKNKEIIKYPEGNKPLESVIIDDDREAKKRDEEEQESQLRDEAVGLFPKIMGSSFDPNSSMDRGKLEIIMRVKKQHPELSDTQLALKIYREMS